MLKRSFISPLVCVSLIATPAFAQTSQPTPAPSTVTADPNEKICQNEAVIGSRLAKHRICATRAEWEERNRQDRQTVEQAQRMIGGPCTTAGNKNTGGPSC
jgi:hypothetical protein